MAHITASRKAAAQQILAKHQGDRAAAKPELRALAKQTRQDITALLTPEQAQTFAQMTHRRKGHHKGGAHGLAAKLSLTAAQRTQWRSIHQDIRAQRAQILDAVGGDKAAAKPEIRALRQEQHTRLLKILTPEQAQTFQDLKAQRHDHRQERSTQ